MELLQQLLDQSSPELEPEPTTKDDAAFWLYSSGSTGRPKACVHLHHDMVVCAEHYAKAILSITENDRSLVLPNCSLLMGWETDFIFTRCGSNQHPVAGPAECPTFLAD